MVPVHCSLLLLCSSNHSSDLSETAAWFSSGPAMPSTSQTKKKKRHLKRWDFLFQIPGFWKVDAPSEHPPPNPSSPATPYSSFLSCHIWLEQTNPVLAWCISGWVLPCLFEVRLKIWVYLKCLDRNDQKGLRTGHRRNVKINQSQAQAAHLAHSVSQAVNPALTSDEPDGTGEKVNVQRLLSNLSAGTCRTSVQTSAASLACLMFEGPTPLCSEGASGKAEIKLWKIFSWKYSPVWNSHQQSGMWRAHAGRNLSRSDCTEKALDVYRLGNAAFFFFFGHDCPAVRSNILRATLWVKLKTIWNDRSWKIHLHSWYFTGNWNANQMLRCHWPWVSC